MPSPVPVPAIKNRTLITCLAASSIVLTLAAFQWTIIDWITPFLMLPVQGAAWLFFGIAVLISLITVIRIRETTVRAFAPIMVCTITIALLATVPFTRIWLAINFRLKQDAREAVALRVANGQLRPNVAHNSSLIALPPSPAVSAGGNEIIFQESPRGTFVFFFTFRGILGSASGFLLIPPGTTPSQFQFSNRLGEVIPYAQNWYFISAAR